MAVAEDTARIMARELGWRPERQQQQVAEYKRLAMGYLPR
jgi:hypothetical protein